MRELIIILATWKNSIKGDLLKRLLILDSPKSELRSNYDTVCYTVKLPNTLKNYQLLKMSYLVLCQLTPLSPAFWISSSFQILNRSEELQIDLDSHKGRNVYLVFERLERDFESQECVTYTLPYCADKFIYHVYIIVGTDLYIYKFIYINTIYIS